MKFFDLELSGLAGGRAADYTHIQDGVCYIGRYTHGNNHTTCKAESYKDQSGQCRTHHVMTSVNVDK